MPRNVINRSISFDPSIFEKMEERRGKLLMDRSEYVKRCILKDMMAGGEMAVEEVPDDFANKAVAHSSRAHPNVDVAGKKKRAKK